MIVIADDITGAAEIAGIAVHYGLQVELLTDVGGSAPKADVVVVATDTRSLSEADAVAETRRVAEWVKAIVADTAAAAGASQALVFKKTDSALRGHVVAELQALLSVMQKPAAVYLPANPSRGRIIRAGAYYIKVGEAWCPIHETDFSFDPEFPARTSVLSERFPQAAAAHIQMPDAVSADDVRQVVADHIADGQVVFAGAADLFAEVLRCCFAACPSVAAPLPAMSSRYVLCGSTQSRPLSIGLPVYAMPRAVYDGEQSADDWLRMLRSGQPALMLSKGLILTIPHRHKTGKAIAVHLRTVMAAVAAGLVAQHVPDELVIEGGATAWAALQALGWHRFSIVQQVAAGVVRMRAACGTIVTLKPGSYPWGGLFSA